MPIRIIQLSDIHFVCENAPAVVAAAAFVRETPFDLLAITGDITQVGRRDEFETAGSWLKGLPGPQISTPGNHDTPWYGLIERVISPFGRYERAIGPAASAIFERPDLSVRAFNSARGWQIRLNWSKGHVSRAQARAAARASRAAPPAAYRLAVCHHPLVEAPNEPITSKVRGGHHAAGVLNAAGVDMILTGHLHVPFVQPLPYGDRRTFSVGAGTLSQRERGVRPSFNVIDIEGNALNVTAMGWDGARFSPLREWTVFLRPRAVA